MAKKLSRNNPLNNSKNIVRRNEKGQLLPGVVLNPAGKPKGVRHLSTMLEEAIKRVADGGTESYDVLLIKRVLKKAINDGDMKAIEHIWDRIEGKAPQSLDITTGGKPIPILGNVYKNNSDQKNSEVEEENQGNSGRDSGK